MNEKFWDLKKSRQDSMINAALKIFALNGYSHASTDEIVAEASVSKGLLFHYFYSKAGLYGFLAEYCARFSLVELHAELRRKEILPFFELLRIQTRAEAAAMRQYPYLTLFLNRVGVDPETSADDRNSLAIYTERLNELIGSCILPETMSPEDAQKIDHILSLVRTNTASSLLTAGSFSPERYMSAVNENIVFFEKFY